MTAPALLQIYIEQSVLLAAGAILFRAAWAWTSRRPRAAGPRGWRDAGLVVAAAALVLPIATRILPRGDEAGPPRRSGAPVVTSPAANAPPGPATWRRSRLPAYRLLLSSSQETAAEALLGLAAAGAALSLWMTGRRRRALRAALSALPVVRRRGRVTIAACDETPVPYAARAGGRAWVVVPTDRLDDAAGLRVLIAHELQHHRQGDLHVLAAVDRLRAVFFWNPAASAWARLMDELQEMACDAAVVGRGRARAREYAELLLAAVRLDGRPRFVPRGATAVSGRSATVLTRRIAMVMAHGGSGRGTRGWVAGAACVALLAGGALVARSAVLATIVESSEVSRLTAKLGAAGLVVPVNDVVLAEVNRWLAAPKERAFLKESRRRLQEQRTMVDAAFARHQVPTALTAVAIVESGFRNLEQKPGFHGAGVWQFIPDTARQFGLVVEGTRDERLDVEKQTEAAARLLADLHRDLGDWPLALAAYSEGGRRVSTVIAEAKTRDAWELMRSGRLGRYAATVVAAALVLEDERLLEEPAPRN